MAQDRYEVTGVVRDIETGLTMPGANIWVPDVRRGINTNTDGRFRLELERGRYDIIASFIGYEPDTLTVVIEPDKVYELNFYLKPSVIEGDEVVVFGDRVAQRVRDLARLRNERRKNLNNYTVTVHKLGLVYETKQSRKNISPKPDPEEGKLHLPSVKTLSLNGFSNQEESEVIAFAERVVEQLFVTPKTYGEKFIARRASDNFFSENEIFSTGGGPLDLNEERVDLNILSEVVSVVGPISQRAPEFYYLDDEPAGDNWPEGTTKIIVTPKSSQRPLFEGVVFIDDNTDKVIGMDLKMNSAGNVFTGVYSLSDFHYIQQYKNIDDFWLPSRTEIEGRIGVIGFKSDFIYRDRWVYADYKINQESFSRGNIPLSGAIVEKEAGKRDDDFWKQAEEKFIDEKDGEEIEKARAYKEERFLVNFFMGAFQTYYQAPTFIENSYFTNVSDFYRFNRVEGHFLGVGLRTPAAIDNFAYKGAAGYATKANDWRYYLEASQFIGNTPLAVEGGVFKKLAIQFADYPHTTGPLNIDEFRYTLTAGLASYDPRNYFERDGIQAGLRLQFRDGFFLRANYLREEQSFLPVVASNSFFNNSITDDDFVPNLNPQVGITPGRITSDDELEGFTPGKFSGFEFHLQYDNRQYRTNGIFRNYLLRRFGWFTDHLIHWSDPGFGTNRNEGFNFLKYRSSAGIRVPLFASHFLLTEVFIGGSDNPLPAQMQFSNNGFYIEDYIRRRPFLSLGFNEAIGNRVSAARVDYDLGTGFVRLFPFSAISQSGIRLRVWGS
ncbi:MAG: DUF5686 family protein, partial [Balneolaceae bacterium]